jgi:diacylglycerol kinase (ATP)
MPSTGTPQRRVSIIRNPAARRPLSDADLAEALNAIRHTGWEPTVTDTRAAGEATSLAREAAGAGVDAVVVSGGDGTVNEVVNGLVGTETALGVIPVGTANVWARELGILDDPAAALGFVTARRSARVDTGVARIGDEAERHFLLMCSAGIDAEVVRAIELRPGLKRRLGRGAFGWPSARTVLVGQPVETELRWADDARRVPLLMVLARNTRLYGSIARLTDEALIDDGELDLLTFEDLRRGFAVRGVHRMCLLTSTMCGHLRSAVAPGLRYERTNEVELNPAGPLPVQLDGEYVGSAGREAPLVLTSAPGSPTVIVPAGVNPAVHLQRCSLEPRELSCLQLVADRVREFSVGWSV